VRCSGRWRTRRRRAGQAAAPRTTNWRMWRNPADAPVSETGSPSSAMTLAEVATVLNCNPVLLPRLLPLHLPDRTIIEQRRAKNACFAATSRSGPCRDRTCDLGIKRSAGPSRPGPVSLEIGGFPPSRRLARFGSSRCSWLPRCCHPSVEKPEWFRSPVRNANNWLLRRSGAGSARWSARKVYPPTAPSI
jgi:hypothetical protein